MPARDDSPLDAPPPDGTALLVHTHVAGVPYYAFADGDLPLDPGSPVEFRREPDNPHDARAIEIYTLDGEKLGYVPRRKNTVPCRLMDAGFELTGRLETVKTPVPSGADPSVDGATKPRLRFAAFVRKPEPR